MDISKNLVYCSVYPPSELLAGDHHTLEFMVRKGVGDPHVDVALDPDIDGQGNYQITLFVTYPNGNIQTLALEKATTPITGHFLASWDAPDNPGQNYLFTLVGTFDGNQEIVFDEQIYLKPYTGQYR